MRSVALFAMVAVTISGCSRISSGPSFPSNVFEQQVVATPEPVATTSPVARLEQQASGLSLSGYVDAAALSSMTDKDKAEASNAQFFALQFGRPGAPRNWSGEAGATGEVTVGPFVRLNSLDCREFTHAVTVSGSTYTNTGTSCRELDGDWHPAATG